LVEEPKKTFENAVEENFVDLVKWLLIVNG
jgi:hypothetical protein